MIHASWMLVGIAGALRLGEPGVLAWVGVGALVWWIGRQRGAVVVGLANAITALRVVIAAAIATLPSDAVVPWGGGLLLLFFVLDGVDGWWARRSGTATAFGAAFDQEADAFMVAVVTVVITRAELAPGWVVTAGVLRYAYVLVVHALRTHGEAPRSLVARHAFGVLVVTLIAVMLVPCPLTRVAVSVGAALIVASFARSLWWSWRGPVTGA
ncbi:CDP-alcohol phosphatidyltransferase family protein [Paraliomyxa miuraensis]|uniref:CDP-alcohol phosphatidyltransferase family protein n=1 Tax=Paraliomyxa miuraensis TaxID=376150 RepID=UPI002256E9BE|nr:CDP-alcohol phosphatidyltransferase family protein [Paraliomyxa miuraensis]MCX4241736.1 CDP-alcohol phosphatidyltransferase family protein [Paraliomyxa miuraensis]